MKQKAIIVDIDGTIAEIQWRIAELLKEKKDWDLINEQSKSDQPKPWCVNLVKTYIDAGYKVIFITGRSDRYVETTREWLEKTLRTPHYVFVDLLMRPDHDYREDGIVKEQLYRKFVEPLYDVEFVVEDRVSVVRHWRSMGLTVLQCLEYSH